MNHCNVKRIAYQLTIAKQPSFVLICENLRSSADHFSLIRTRGERGRRQRIRSTEAIASRHPTGEPHALRGS